MARITKNVTQIKAPSDPGIPSGVISGAFTSGVSQTGAGISKVGTVISGFADKMQEAEDRIKARKAAIDRAKIEAKFDTDMDTSRRSITDLTEEQSLIDFGDESAGVLQEVLGGHIGNELSRLELEERLEISRGKHIDALSLAATKEVDRVANSLVEGEINSNASQAATGIKTFNEAVNDSIEAIESKSAAFRTDQRAKLRNSAIRQTGTAILDRMIRNKEYDAAEDFMVNEPSVASLLGEATRQRLRNAIHTGRKSLNDPTKAVGAEKGRLAGEESRAEFKAITGFDPNAEQALELAGVDNPDEDDGLLGNSFNAKRLEAFADHAESFGDGILDPKIEGQIIAAAVDYTQIKLVPNPETGVLQRVQNVLPPALVAAFRNRGMPVPGETAVPEAGAGPGARRETLTQQLLPPNEQSLVPGQQPSTSEPTQAPEPVQEVSPSEAAGQQSDRPRDLTIFEMSPLVAGPGAVFGHAAGKIPFTGGQAPEMTQARERIDFAKRDFVRILQNSPRFAQSEREGIEEDIDLGTKLFDSPEAFEQRILAMDDSLSIRLRNAIATASNDSVGEEEREHALNVANGIAQFRQILIPPRIHSPEEAVEFFQNNPPGTVLMIQDDEGRWVVKRVRGK